MGLDLGFKLGFEDGFEDGLKVGFTFGVRLGVEVVTALSSPVTILLHSIQWRKSFIDGMGEMHQEMRTSLTSQGTSVLEQGLTS